MLEAFAEAGYRNTAVRVVAASDYGVPQLRKQAIFFGVRDEDDLGMDAGDFLDKSLELQRQPGTTVRDAIGDLSERTADHYEPLKYPGTQQQSEVLDELRLDRDGRWYTAAGKQRAAGGADLLHNHHTKEIQQRRRDLIALLAPGAQRRLTAAPRLGRAAPGEVAPVAPGPGRVHDPRADAPGPQRVGAPRLRALDHGARGSAPAVVPR